MAVTCVVKQNLAMKNSEIESLREALGVSPANVPLRLLLAGKLLQIGEIEESEAEYRKVLTFEKSSIAAKEGLIEVAFQKQRYSAVIVIAEELTAINKASERVQILFAKSLLRENSIADAQEIYEKLLKTNPSLNDEELDAQLRMPSFAPSKEEEEDFYEEENEGHFLMEKPKINFSDVGGMDHLKEEIGLKIIKPLEHADLYAAYGKKIGGGILLYGPPGCGKTYLAKATAGEINANFINVGINDILDMWVGKSEGNMRRIFEVARRNTPCVLFFDEVDALGASRSDMKNSAGRHVINQFLSELDGVDANNEGILVLGATNAPWHLDAAFRRPGRFDRIIFVPPPDQTSLEKIIALQVAGKPISDIDYRKVASKTKMYSGADIKALVDIAVEKKLQEAFKTGIPGPIATKDLLEAVKLHKPTTSDWFNTAKNYALFANESGLYDEILKYIK